MIVICVTHGFMLINLANNDRQKSPCARFVLAVFLVAIGADGYEL
jgi:hypothetical protein